MNADVKSTGKTLREAPAEKTEKPDVAIADFATLLHRGIERLVGLQKAMTHIGGRQYLVRQLNDHKGSIALEDLSGDGLNAYAEVCGELLARGHARSGDALAIKGYIGICDKILKSIVRFAVDYAALTEADFEAFQKAIKQGQVNVAA
jgi:hypothetical protein